MKKKVTAISLAAILAISGIPAVYAASKTVSPAPTASADVVAAETEALPAAVEVPAEEPVAYEKIIIEPYYPQTDLSVEQLSKEEEAKILEELILFVKENIRDTDVYDSFNYYSYLNGYGKTSFSLNWNSSDGQYPYMYVTIDSDKHVEYYYVSQPYVYYEESARKKIQLPSFTKQDALDTAIEFVKTVAPSYADEISESFANIYVSKYNSYFTYSVTLYRVKNGVPIENESIRVEISSDGEVTSYSNYGTKNITGDAPTTVAQYRTIINAFKESNPLDLKYIASYNKGTQKYDIRLAYVTPNNGSNVIDAATGKLYSLQYKDTYSDGVMMDQVMPETAAAAESSADYAVTRKTLSQVEQTMVDKHLDLLNSDDVKEILLKHPDLGFNEKFQLNHSNLSSHISSYSDKIFYTLNTSYSYNDDAGNYGYIYATVDAETGEIKNYSYSDSSYPVIPYTATAEEQTAFYDSLLKKEEAAVKAEALLKELYGDKFSEYKANTPTWNEKDTYGYIYYVRQVNGIPFGQDTISISFDRVSGKVTNIYFEYASDAVFPSADSKITVSSAMDKLFAEFPLNVYYKPYLEIDEEKSVMYYTYNTELEKKLALVYSYNEMSGVAVDALTGKLTWCYSSDEAVYTPTQYYDSSAVEKVKDHEEAEKILAIYNLGGFDITKDFDADSAIEKTQFENIVRSVISTNSYGEYYIDYYYSDAVVTEIHTDEPSVSDQYMTREQAIVAIVSMLGYSDVAKISDIFKNDGDIFNGVDPSLTGFYAIANAFGLLNDISSDTSDGKLTYAGACCLIYNYILFTNAEG